MGSAIDQSIYYPATADRISAVLRSGKMPETFTRRMRTLNILSGATLQKIDTPLIEPFHVMDVHHALDAGVNADMIVNQFSSNALAQAVYTGNIRPLWNEAQASPMLEKAFHQGWIQLFINKPFDPICVMLAMRSKLLLEAMDELGHSYELQRALGFGYIDFEGEEDWEGGDPNDCLPPGIDNPLELPQPGDPGYVPPEPQPGDPDYIPPIPQPGDPGYIPPQPGDPDYIPPDYVPGDPDYVPPQPGDPDYVPPQPGDPDYIPPDSVPGDPDYVPPQPGDPDYVPPQPGDPDYVPPAPLPGDPDYTGPIPGDPDYVGPAPQPGDPDYTGPMPGDPGYVPPAPLPGEPGYIPPAPGDPGYVPPQPGDPGYFPPCPQPGDPGYGPPMPGEDGYSLSDSMAARLLALIMTIPRFGYPPGQGPPYWDHGMIASPGAIFAGDTGGKSASKKHPSASGPNCCLHSDGLGGYVTLGYTSQEMAVDEEQELTVEGYIPGCAAQNYKWSIISGGGSLSADHGWSVTYTAPSSNEDCNASPVIALSCSGDTVDTLEIAIQAYTGHDYAAYEDTSCVFTGPYWRIFTDAYYCDGTAKVLGHLFGWYMSKELCEAANAGALQCPCDCTSRGIHDCRGPECGDPSLLSQGCCPEALL